MRRIGARLLLLAAAVLVALALAEGGLRLFEDDLAPPGHHQIRYPGFLIEGGSWRLEPGASFEAVYDDDPLGNLPPGLRVEYALNDRGFRDESFSRPAEKTVAVLGDSFAFGEGVASTRRFTNVAERMAPAGSVRYLNLGVPGYTTEDEAILARDILPLLEPDVVVVAYCLNDPAHVRETVAEFNGIVNRPGRESDSPLHLVRLLHRFSEARRITAGTIDWYRSLYSGEDCAFARSTHHLLEIKRVSEEVGARMVVLVMPLFVDLYDYPFEAAHRRIADWCSENGIAVLDTLELFRGRDAEEFIVHPNDRHPNASAHLLIGETLPRFLDLR